jgi:hypothetical protein
MAHIIQPTYSTTQPSTGKTVKFRPFTVKEEKALLLALQEESITAVTDAISNVISACTDGRVDPQQIPYYDAEYLFLQIRSKSVGEIIDLVGSCDCSPKAKTQFSVDIADTVVEPKPTGIFTVKIPDSNYTMQVDHPSIDDFASLVKSEGESAIEVVVNCTKSVMTDDEVLDWSQKEKLEFVESMTPKQQKDISKFLKDMPLTKIPAKYKCSAGRC